MKIYTEIVLDIETGTVLSSTSEDYAGPVDLLMGTPAIGDLGGGLGLEGGGGGDFGEDQPELGDQGDLGDEIPDDTLPDDQGEPGGGEGEPGDKPAEVKEPKEVLPAALSKALRELKAAHPEQAGALKELNKAYYENRGFKQVFQTVDEARTIRAALDAVDGTDGIASMRAEISSIEQFDNMAREGNPKVIEGLADEFPDGFKRLVPAAVERLARLDPQAYRETMRGPLLQSLEGDGVMDAVADAMEYIKAALADPTTAPVYFKSAQTRLNQLTTWYNNLKQEETAYKGRYQDPRLKELEGREQQLREGQAQQVRSNVVRDLNGYLTETLRPGISKVLEGKTLAQGGRARFEDNVKTEINKILGANAHYRTSLQDLIGSGKVEQAIRFAKPFIDSARQKAISAVYTDLFGNAPANGTRRPAPNGQRQVRENGTAQAQTVQDRPIPVRTKPDGAQIDWAKDPNRTLYATHKAYLKTGKLVSW